MLAGLAGRTLRSNAGAPRRRGAKEGPTIVAPSYTRALAWANGCRSSQGSARHANCIDSSQEYSTIHAEVLAVAAEGTPNYAARIVDYPGQLCRPDYARKYADYARLCSIMPKVFSIMLPIMH